MHRMLVRVAALALCTSALSACGVMSGGDQKVAPPQSASGSSPMAIAADLTQAIHQAQQLRLSGDLDGSMRVISQLMLAAPDDPRVVGEYGKLLVQQGRFDDAAQFLRRAVELDPSNWSYYSALGVAYDQLKDPANAKNAYEHALALKPGEPAVLNNYAMSRMLAGDTTNARALLLQAKANGSTDPKIDQNLALLDSETAPKPAPVVAAVAPVHAAEPVHAPAAVVTHAAAPVASNATTPVAAKPATPVASIAVTPAHPVSAVATNALPPAPLRTTAPAAVTPAAVRAVPTVAVNNPAPVSAHPAAPLAGAVSPVASGAPTPITKNGVSIVMQAVPVDPKAGKVASTTHKWVKPTAVAATPAPLHVAAAKPATPVPAPKTPEKVAKTAKPSGNQIPSLRMTADAAKP